VSEPGPARQTAPFGRRLLRVTGNEELGAYRVLRVAACEGADVSLVRGVSDGRTDGWAPDPGQFAMLAAQERWGGGEEERPHLPRAFSFARFTREGEAHFLLEDVGPGTRRLCELRPGERVWLLGPLGVGFRAPAAGRRAILVGGGAGIAPLAILQDALLAGELPAAGQDVLPAGEPPAAGERAPASPAVLLGFRDRDHAAGAALLRGALLATDDGSVGHRGLVTELLEAELGRDPEATVYACGPAPMLEAVRALCAERAVPAQLALESGMACGFGACFGCVVPRRGGGYLRVCVEGPVIDAADLERVDAHAGAPA
jgi:dihydroorotate dehydrogenase electron transfer subunit